MGTGWVYASDQPREWEWDVGEVHIASGRERTSKNLKEMSRTQKL